MELLTSLDPQTYRRLVYAWGALGVASALGIHLARQLPISSRNENRALARFGTIDKKLGWLLMETPILIVVCFFYLTGRNPIDASAVIVGAFVIHYVNRALVFPHRIRVRGKRMPAITVVATMVFYTINGYLIGYYFGSLRAYPLEWLLDPRFVLGLALFVAGAAINVRCDNVLIGLRGPGESGYAIPRGGLFEYVSCPNYLGEIVEWLGFAIMSWSLPGVVYAIWVSLALVATGLGTHRWYVERFGADYPRARKAVLPYLV